MRNPQEGTKPKWLKDALRDVLTPLIQEIDADWAGTEGDWAVQINVIDSEKQSINRHPDDKVQDGPGCFRRWRAHRLCECSAWKTRTHYHHGPLQLFARPTEPNVTWHMDFIVGLPEIKIAMTGVCLNAILGFTEANGSVAASKRAMKSSHLVSTSN